jgi:[NiFe] hydrogenase assembly HybE family chaperone
MYPAVETLLAAYRDIVQPRMRSMPMFNAALQVEAVGFEPHDGRLCGVLITPWFMNLVLLPGQGDDWSSREPGSTLGVTFPAGEYECRLSVPEGIPAHLSLPLFATVTDFPDQGTARLIAEDILQRLHQDKEESVQNSAIAAGAGKSGWPWPLSRRDLLLGRSAPEEGKE